MKKNMKGISLIVLIVTIIVMIIIAGAIIISLSNTNIIDQAENAVRISEKDNIRDAVLTSMILTNDGGVDVSATYEAAKAVLEDQVKSIGALQEDGTFIVEGQYDIFTLKIYQVGVDIEDSGSAGDAGNEDETLDGLQGTYEPTTNVDYPGYVIMTVDGKGNWVQKIATDQVNQEVTGTYVWDKNTESATFIMGEDEADFKLYNLEEHDNKILYLHLSTTFTTNGLAGLYMEGLEGKTYNLKDESASSITKLVFTTDHNVITYSGENSQESGQYFKAPTHVVNNEDKFMTLIGGGTEYTVERDSEGNIIKIIRANNSEAYYELETETGAE